MTTEGEQDTEPCFRQVFLVTKVPPTEMGTDETYAAVLRAVKELGTPIDLVCC